MRQYATWTDTDDAIVLTFPPREAAQILGRSLQSVYHRRSLKDLGGENRDRKPRKRRLRAYFQRQSVGEREEGIPARPGRKCRICQRHARYRALCRRCYSRMWYLLKCGYVSRAEVARLWPWAVVSPARGQDKCMQSSKAAR
jgi:hypothetical protein